MPENATAGQKAAASREESVRAEAVKAMAMKENNEGNTLATLWNAATWLVDRDGEGKAKPSDDAIDSILFGARAKRVEEIHTLIEVILADGTVQTMNQTQALEIGVDPSLVAKKMIEDMSVTADA